MQRCGKAECDPRRVRGEGADHAGYDLFVRCKSCRREGPYFECWNDTPELWDKAIAAWADDLRARPPGGSRS